MAYRILLVDDEADILEFIRYNLEKEDYEVFTASNGREAVETALEYGRYCGLGQWRNGGYGRFTWKRIEDKEIRA